MTDAALVAGLNTLADAVGLAHEKLDILVEAATGEPEPSKLAPLLEQLVRAVNANTEALGRIEAQTKPRGTGSAHV
jgi:hypothetical protein